MKVSASSSEADSDLVDEDGGDTDILSVSNTSSASGSDDLSGTDEGMLSLGENC